MLSLDDQPCCICGNRSSQQFHQTSYPEHQAGKFVLRRCDGCGLLFNSPRPDDQELAQLYGRNYYFFLRSDDREFSRIVEMHQRTIALVEPQITSRQSIDIGCGRGYLPAVLKQLGWDASGIEISSDASEFARKTLGLDVFTGTIETYAASNSARQFPLVTAIDVIEHVPSPEAFIASAGKIVAKGGYLIIDTPNAAAQNITLKGVNWKGFNPFHIYLFTIDHLRRLLERHGFTVEKSFSYGNTRTPTDLKDRLISGLKAAHLLGPVARTWFKLRKSSAGGSDPSQHIAKAAQRIKNEPSYPQTADASAPLAQTKTGDNIVVIARKS